LGKKKNVKNAFFILKRFLHLCYKQQSKNCSLLPTGYNPPPKTCYCGWLPGWLHTCLIVVTRYWSFVKDVIVRNVVMGEVLRVSVCAFRAGDYWDVTCQQKRDWRQHCSV